MFSDKLLRLLREFSTTERKQLRAFLMSPFFNTNDDFVQLFDLVDEQLREEEPVLGENPALEKKRVWKKLFGKIAYDDEKMRRLSSGLTQYAFQYLAYVNFAEHPFTEQIYLANAVNHPRLDKHFRGVVRQTERNFDKSGLRNANYHLHRFLLEGQNHRHLEMREEKQNDLSHLVKADYHLDCYYISRKLQHYCDVLGYRSSLAKDIELPQLPGLLEHLPDSDYMKEPAVQTYYLVSQMLLQPEDQQTYYRLKEYLQEHLQGFSLDEQRALYTHLINYCIDAQINKGVVEFFQELFELYRKALEDKVLLEKGKLPPNHYKNIITVGLKVKAYDWIEKFIERYSELLPEGEKEDAVAFNLAKVAFDKQEYQRVIELLREVEYRNIVYALGGKLILLRTYFEQGDFLPLDSLVDSFRIYLRRNKLISTELKRQYLNLLRFIRRLTNVAPGDQQAIEKLENQIGECKNLVARRWLLEKAEELK